VFTTDKNGSEKFRPPEGYQPGCMIACTLVVVFTIIALVVMSIGDAVAMQILGKLTSVDPVHGTMRLVLLFFLALIGWRALQYKNPIRKMGLTPEKGAVREILFGILLGAAAGALAFATIAIPGSLSVTDSLPQTAHLTYTRTFNWLTVLYMIFVYATAEEVLFRGFLYPWMRRSTGMMIALVGTSLIFTSFHFGNPDFLTSPFPFINIVLASIFLALLREYTGNLWLAMGAHFSWNFILVAVGIPVSGLVISIQPRNWFLVAGGPDWVTGGAFGPEGGIGATVSMVIMIYFVWYLIRMKNIKRELN